MVHAMINGLKSNNPVLPILKPDLEDYSPVKYFDYDEITNRYIVNTDIDDPTLQSEIQNMIDKVLYLNHGVVLTERKNYIEEIRFKMQYGLPFQIDRFFTAIEKCFGI
jgi:hypothetical protein